MKFFKENSYDIVKLFINQIGITIFAMIMYTAGGMIQVGGGISLPIRLGISIFSTLFYFVLIYMTAWDWGAKDKIRIEGGKVEKDSFKGFKLALLANVPNFILIIPALIFTIIILITNASFAVSAFEIFNVIIIFILSMYVGTVQGALNFLPDHNGAQYKVLFIVGFLVMTIVATLVTNLGYRLGLKEKKIFSFKKANN